MEQVIFSDRLLPLAEKLSGYPSVFILADRHIRRFIAEPLAEFLAERGVAVRGMLCMKLSERKKTLRTVEKIVRWLVNVGADRDALLLAVGGGVTTDIAGFTAGIYKRGVRYANVPTTLLAQVDASTGGKTGCNVGDFKNMAGLFRSPEFTFINPDYIRTLPWREFSAGYAELLKTFLIADPQSYRDAVMKDDYDNMLPLIREAVNVKMEIVGRDERDRGERRLLNLGHTYAHAIEYKSAHSLLHRRIKHGHAVAMGIVMAARRSEKEKLAPRGLADKIERDFRTVGLPVDCPWTGRELAPIMASDKKAADGKLHLVLLRDIGRPVII